MAIAVNAEKWMLTIVVNDEGRTLTVLVNVDGWATRFESTSGGAIDNVRDPFNLTDEQQTAAVQVAEAARAAGIKRFWYASSAICAIIGETTLCVLTVCVLGSDGLSRGYQLSQNLLCRHGESTTRVIGSCRTMPAAWKSKKYWTPVFDDLIVAGYIASPDSPEAVRYRTFITARFQPLWRAR